MAEITSYNVPNENVPRKVKGTQEYGLAWANYLESQLYKLNPNINERTSRMKNNIKYAAGSPSTIDMRASGGNGYGFGSGIGSGIGSGGLGGNGVEGSGNQGTSPLQIDVRPQENRIKKNVNLIIELLLSKQLKVECNAIDPESKLIEQRILDLDKAHMILSQIDKKHNISGRTGIPLTPPNAKIPEDDEEVEIFAELKGKVGVSLACEEAIQFVLDNNDWDWEIKRKILFNLITNNIAGVLCEYDENYNIVLSVPEVYDMGFPYSKKDTFNNIPYCWVIKYLTIQEIALTAKNPDGSPKFSEKELFDIAKSFQGANYNNPLWNSGWGNSYEGFYANYTSVRPYYNFNIPTLRFWFLSTSTESLVKMQVGEQTTYRWKNKPSDNKNDKNKKEIVTTKTKEFRYGGFKIINSPYLFNYKEDEDLPREKIQGGYSPKTSLPLTIIAPDIYDMENKSKVEAAIPAQDQLWLTDQKIHQCLIQFRPVGYAINWAILEDMKAGTGNDKNKNPVQQHDDFALTNLLFYYARDQFGNPANLNPVQDVPSGFPESFRDLMILRQLHVQTIDNEMGVSPAMNTALPSPEMPVNALEGGRQATLNSINDIYTAAQNLILRMSKNVLFPMIQDCIEMNREGFVAALGESATSEIETIKQIPLATLGININVGSTDEEKAQFMQGLDLDIKTGIITSVDKLDIIRALKQNEKLASGLLKQRIKANQKIAMAMKAQDSQLNGQVQQQSNEQAAKNEQERIQMQLDADMRMSKFNADQKIRVDNNMGKINIDLQEKKNEGLAVQGEIAVGGKVRVTDALVKGDIVKKQIEGQYGIAEKHIIHHSGVIQNEQTHNHTMEEIAATPKPITKSE